MRHSGCRSKFHQLMGRLGVLVGTHVFALQFISALFRFSIAMGPCVGPACTTADTSSSP